MGIMSLIRWLFGVDAAAPSDAMKLDGTTEATLARSLSALPPDERGWITFAEAASCSRPRAHNTRSEKRTKTAEETLSRSRRSTGHAGQGAGLFRTRSDRCDDHCLRSASPLRR